MAVTSVPWDAPVPSPSSPPVDLRRDIEGLRPFAVLPIVTYHVWLGRVSGGVDVFLLLSAFFLYPGTRAVEGATLGLPLVVPHLVGHWGSDRERLATALASVTATTGCVPRPGPSEHAVRVGRA